MHSQAVIQLDLCGKFIFEYSSKKEAGEITNISRAHISDCCNNIRAIAGGFLWINKNEYDPSYNYSYEERKELCKGKTGNYIRKNIKSVYCIELDEQFETTIGAKKKYGISESTIIKCCKKYYGFKSAGKHPITGEPLHWVYLEEAIQLGYITNKKEI